MFNVSPIKVSELASILEITPPVISKRLKSKDQSIVKSNNRITGITPEGIEEYFRSRGQDHLYRSFFAVISSVCGGTQKSSSSLTLLALFLPKYMTSPLHLTSTLTITSSPIFRFKIFDRNKYRPFECSILDNFIPAPLLVHPFYFSFYFFL